MTINVLYILGGLLLLPLGAEGLVRGSTGLALRMGVTPLAIGLTVVAFGTGSPELVVSIEAARAGNSGIALGNVVGSNIGNIALVLALAALAKPMPVRSELIRREVPLMIGVTLLLCVLLLDGELSRLEGLFLVLGAVAYTAFAYWMAKREEADAACEEFDEACAAPERRSVLLDVAFVGAGLVALVLGAQLLLKGAVSVAETLGISEVVIGLTIVAVGTSLPELATSVLASVRDEPDVAYGNVIGSNVLNILAVLGVTALISPFDTSGLRPIDLAVMVATAVLLLPLMWRGRILNRWEGALLLVGYAAYIYSLVS